MNSNKLKDEIQDKGVELAKIHPFIIFEYGTGVGKSLAFIKAMEQLGGNWNIVVAETNHIQNWKDEFKKHSKEHLLKKVKFFCYASLHKHLNGENYCFDEFHNGLLSDKRLSALESIYNGKLKRLIGLSATLSRKQKENLNEIIPNVYYHKISISHAIENNILPEPKIYLLGVELNNIKQTEKFMFTKDKYKLCTQREWYTLQSNRIDYLKQEFFNSRSEWNKKKWLMSGGVRKKFLANVKTSYTKQLLKKLEDKRLICFTNSIEQSEILSDGYSVHSNISADLREEMIKDFNEGKIDKLFTTRMLREGMNLNNIEAGIMIQLDNNVKSFVQSSGRIMRSEFPEYYILYVKNTQDETYLENALEGFNRDYVYELNFNKFINE